MCALTSTFFMLVLFHRILCHSLSYCIAPSSSLPHSIILYNLLYLCYFLLPLIVCYLLSMYATSSCLISHSLILLSILFPTSHFSSYMVPLPLIPSFSFSSQRILLPLILCYFLLSYPTSFLSHTTTSYPTFCHFFSSYTTSPRLIVSCCTILILVILFCFLPPHILSYLLCSKTLFSLLSSHPVLFQLVF